MTEKQYAPTKNEKKITNKVETPKQKAAPTEKKVEEKKKEFKKNVKAEKEAKKVVPKIKKTEAKVDVQNLPISTKKSMALCKFIKYKTPEQAIKDLEEVLMKRKAVPTKGEMSHQKGKGISGAAYPKKATEHFLTLVKSLQANANYSNVENPVIVTAVANIGVRPMGKFGRVQRKRTHILLIAKEKKAKEKKK